MTLLAITLGLGLLGVAIGAGIWIASLYNQLADRDTKILDQEREIETFNNTPKTSQVEWNDLVANRDRLLVEARNKDTTIRQIRGEYQEQKLLADNLQLKYNQLERDRETEQVRAEGSEALRQLEQNQNTPEFAREGRRMLDVASQRYHGHYLTERLLSNLPIEPALVSANSGASEKMPGPNSVMPKPCLNTTPCC